MLDEDQEIHDYNMWESQIRMLARKPYVTSESADEANYWNSSSSKQMAKRKQSDNKQSDQKSGGTGGTQSVSVLAKEIFSKKLH